MRIKVSFCVPDHFNTLVQIAQIFQVEVIFLLAQTKVPGVVEIAFIRRPYIITSAICKYFRQADGVPILTEDRAFGVPDRLDFLNRREPPIAEASVFFRIFFVNIFQGLLPVHALFQIMIRVAFLPHQPGLAIQHGALAEIGEPCRLRSHGPVPQKQK